METDGGIAGPVAERHRGNLEAFVLRARRVEAHSLAADRQALRALSAAAINLSSRGGTIRIGQELPAEELVESAAARIRPLMLENEDCNVLKALAAVKYFCRAQPDVTERIKQVRKAWQRRVAESSTGEAGYWVTVDDSAGGTAHLDQVRLALAWIYGDVVHHDHERRQAADPFGLLERYRAAVPLVAFVMWFAIDVLSSVRELQDDGYLDLDPQVFDREVVLASTTWELPARAYAAPVGTPPPADIEAPFGAGWVELSRPPVPEDE